MVYNHLNLPKQIEKNNSQLSYSYLADGTKIGKSLYISDLISNQVVDTDYLDGFVYTTAYSFGLAESLRSDDPAIKEIALAGQEEALELEDKEIASTATFGQAVLEFFPTAEGFYDYKNSKYIYQYKDHLGNVRLSYSRDTATGTFKSEESNTYYPFGMNHIGARSGGDQDSSFSPSTTYKNYKYNGKELQETGMYDYGARFYMPDIGRWGVVDPLAEQYRRHTTYNYTMNNPIRFIDPDGRGTEDWIKKDGKWTYDANIKTVDQARSAGADAFAKNGAYISDAKIGSNGEAGIVRLNEGGTANYMESNLLNNGIALLNSVNGMVENIQYENYISVITDGYGRSGIEDGYGLDMIKVGDRVDIYNKGEILAPSGGGSGDMFGKALSKFNHLFGNLANSFNNGTDAAALMKG